MLVVSMFAQAQNQTISVSGLAYTPNQVTVNVGDTIFFNFPNDTHPILISGVDTFRTTGGSGRDTSRYFVAHRPGVFPFVCTIHSSMTGTITINMPPTATSGDCGEVFISEYAEGSSNNKYIEIYNPTQNSIDLTNYYFYILPNGGVQNTSGSYSKLDRRIINKILPANKTIVLFNGGFNAGMLANIAAAGDTVRTALTSFNGDDALLVLNPARQTIDMLGNFGEDLPGTSGSWPVVGVNGTTGSTQNFTLVRINTVKKGNASWAAQAAEWNVLAQDDFTNANIHDMIACPLGIQNISASEIGLKVFPNPMENDLNFESKEIILKIELYNTLGMMITQNITNSNNVNLAVNNFTTGMYIAKVYSNKGVSVVQVIK